MEKFESYVYTRGVLIADGSMVQKSPQEPIIRFFTIPATQLAKRPVINLFQYHLAGNLLKKQACISEESFEKGPYGCSSIEEASYDS
jgi:hypothetical protein